MSASGSRALAAACVGVLWTAVASAPAAPTSPPGDAPRNVVLLAASDAEERALSAVKADLRELVEPIALRAPQSGRGDKWSLSRFTQQHRALAAVWLDQTSTRYVTVYVFDPQSQRLGMRRLPRRSQADADESVGVVLRATLEALLEGREAPLEAVALPAEPVRAEGAAAAPPRKGQERASLRTGYLGVGFADSSIEHGASFGASLSLSRLLRLGLGYAIVQPAELATDQARITLVRRPLDAFLGLTIQLPGVELYADAGASLDFRERRSEVIGTSLRPTSDDAYAVVSVLGRIKLGRELWPQLRVDFGPAFEVPVNEPELVVERAGSDQTLSQFPIRPRLEAGVSLVIR
jgi:hypothetical protein